MSLNYSTKSLKLFWLFFISHALLKHGKSKIDTEGLNSTKYKLINKILTPLYTKILVYYNQTEILPLEYVKNITSLEKKRKEDEKKRKLEEQKNRTTTKIATTKSTQMKIKL